MEYVKTTRCEAFRPEEFARLKSYEQDHESERTRSSGVGSLARRLLPATMPTAETGRSNGHESITPKWRESSHEPSNNR
jgi:hypothetical protein